MKDNKEARTAVAPVTVKRLVISSLEDFLRGEAKDILGEDRYVAPIVSYQEDVNDDAKTDAWLDNNTSYIWTVGVLAVVDGNKRDWGYLFIGHQREPGAPFEFIGKLHWADGENDDPKRCLGRYIKCAKMADILFER